jgi:hypothetical protein
MATVFGTVGNDLLRGTLRQIGLMVCKATTNSIWEHLTYAMSINTYSSQKLENLQLDHKREMRL